MKFIFAVAFFICLSQFCIVRAGVVDDITKGIDNLLAEVDECKSLNRSHAVVVLNLTTEIAQMNTTIEIIRNNCTIEIGQLKSNHAVSIAHEIQNCNESITGINATHATEVEDLERKWNEKFSAEKNNHEKCVQSLSESQKEEKILNKNITLLKKDLQVTVAKKKEYLKARTYFVQSITNLMGLAKSIDAYVTNWGLASIMSTCPNESVEDAGSLSSPTCSNETVEDAGSFSSPCWDGMEPPILPHIRDTLTSLGASLSAIKQGFEDNIDSKIAKINETYQEALKNLSIAEDAKIEAINSTHKTSLEKLEKEKNDTISDLISKLQGQIDLVTNKDREITESTTVNANLTASLQEKNKLIADQSLSMGSMTLQLEEKEQELKKIKDLHKKELVQLSTEKHDERMSAISHINEAHSIAMEKARKDYDARLSATEARLGTELHNLDNEKSATIKLLEGRLEGMDYVTRQQTHELNLKEVLMTKLQSDSVGDAEKIQHLEKLLADLKKNDHENPVKSDDSGGKVPESLNEAVVEAVVNDEVVANGETVEEVPESVNEAVGEAVVNDEAVADGETVGDANVESVEEKKVKPKGRKRKNPST